MVVSARHEALVELFRQRPALAAELLAGPLSVPVPEFESASLGSGELGDPVPIERRADAVVVLTGTDGPVLGIVVEIQLSPAEEKRWSWPGYAVALRARLRCPAALLVVCADARVARWAAAPIALGPGFVMQPLVLEPGRVPIVTDPDIAAADPELTVLSAMAHGAGPDGARVLSALLAAIGPDEQGALYADVVLAVLPAAARRHLEKLMTTGAYAYQSDFARRYYSRGQAEGKAEGEARGVLTVLAARGITVSDEVRARITGCTDLDQLDTWLRRAAVADAAADVFD